MSSGPMQQSWRRARRILGGRRRIFFYEYVTGGGLLDDDFTRLQPLAVEGLAMADAVMEDLRQIPDVRPTTLLDARLAVPLTNGASNAGRRLVESSADRDCAFDDEVRRSDGVLLIAPETDGILARLAKCVEDLGGRLLSPASEFCAWAADKSAVAETLALTQAVPSGLRLTAADAWPSDFPAPAVLKPNDGCGSQQVLRLDDTSRDARPDRNSTWRLEQYAPGEAASVLVLLGESTRSILFAFWQNLSDDGKFEYLGGSGPLPTDKQQRVETLIDRVFEPLPEWRGFIGFDVVLGSAADGSQDYVIEINPRLTTSYVAARTMYHTNLMQLMLALLDGREVELIPRIGTLRFEKDGTTDGFWIDKRSPAVL
ncbi:MAG: ATP-grasp domain-containing protein [Pirellulales bacterium]